MEGLQVSLIELLRIVWLEFDEGLDVALDVSHGDAELLYVLHRAIVFSIGIFLPDVFKQFEVVRLFEDHLFLLVEGLFVLKAYEGQLFVEIVLFLKQSIHLSQQQFLSKGLAYRLEFTNLVELVVKLGFFVDDFLVFLFVLLDNIADGFLYFS